MNILGDEETIKRRLTFHRVFLVQGLGRLAIPHYHVIMPYYLTEYNEVIPMPRIKMNQYILLSVNSVFCSYSTEWS